MTEREVRQHAYWVVGQTMTRVFVAGVLLLAAYLKYVQLLTPDGRRHWGWHLLQVEGELALGVWLLAGVWRRGTFGVAVGVFGVFCLVALGKAVGGEVSCGCFGRVEVNPWVTLGVDVVIVGLLLVWFPQRERTRRQWLKAVVGGLVVLAVGGVAGWRVAGYEPGRFAADGGIVGDGRHVELDVQSWVGRRFPLGAYLEGGPEMGEGRWTVMLVRHDCPLCHAALEELARRAAGYPDREVLGRIVVVEVPPFGEFPQLERLRGVVRVARLRGDREWVVATPAVVKVREGVVTEGVRGYVELPEVTTRPSTRETAHALRPGY